jgi:hypothetical protein
MRPLPASYNSRMPLAEESLRADKQFPLLRKKGLIFSLSGIAQTAQLNAVIVRITLCASVRGNQLMLRMGRKGETSE